MYLLLSVCKVDVCMNVCICVVVLITCRDFLKILMLLLVLFNCTVQKVGCSVIVNFSLIYIQFLVSHFLKQIVLCTFKDCFTVFDVMRLYHTHLLT